MDNYGPSKLKELDFIEFNYWRWIFKSIAPATRMIKLKKYLN